jgi:hypothetical protein
MFGCLDVWMFHMCLGVDAPSGASLSDRSSKSAAPSKSAIRNPPRKLADFEGAADFLWRIYIGIASYFTCVWV